MAHGDIREGKWRGNWRMEWVASTLHTTLVHGISSITTADSHNSSASSRLNWRPPADLNGLIRFAERRNLVSACVPSHFKWHLPIMTAVQCFHFSLDANRRRMMNELTRKATKLWRNLSRRMCIKYEGTGNAENTRVLAMHKIRGYWQCIKYEGTGYA